MAGSGRRSLQLQEIRPAVGVVCAMFEQKERGFIGT